MHHPNLCISGERCTCINRHSLTHREERSRLRIYGIHTYLLRPTGQPTGPPYVCEPVPCTHVRVYISLARRLTPAQPYDRPDRYSESLLEGERSEKGESKTRRDADMRGEVERRVGSKKRE